jgi:hypothetical protein
MATLEIFRLDENGAGWVSLENATTSEKIDLEWALANAKVSEIKVRRLDNPKVRTCQICELAHEGLYCSNCFTGERVRLGYSKFAKVMRLHEVRR